MLHVISRMTHWKVRNVMIFILCGRELLWDLVLTLSVSKAASCTNITGMVGGLNKNEKQVLLIRPTSIDQTSLYLLQHSHPVLIMR